MGRILRELIELTERDEDVELVDALHDALEVVVAGDDHFETVAKATS